MLYIWIYPSQEGQYRSHILLAAVYFLYTNLGYFDLSSMLSDIWLVWIIPYHAFQLLPMCQYFRMFYIAPVTCPSQYGIDMFYPWQNTSIWKWYYLGKRTRWLQGQIPTAKQYASSHIIDFCLHQFWPFSFDTISCSLLGACRKHKPFLEYCNLKNLKPGILQFVGQNSLSMV